MQRPILRRMDTNRERRWPRRSQSSMMIEIETGWPMEKWEISLEVLGISSKVVTDGHLDQKPIEFRKGMTKEKECNWTIRIWSVMPARGQGISHFNVLIEQRDLLSKQQQQSGYMRIIHPR